MDQASVTNRQTATANVTLDLDQVRDFLAQAQTALPQLPKPVQQEVHPLLEAIDRELKKKEPMPGKIRTILGSLQKVVEGATGNLVAQGVITMVRAILGM